jgi:putative thioredoxin
MSDWIKDVGSADFQQAVIERSAVVPVVVDFWAPWCAPCRALGPAIEREVTALAGKVELAKVDTDKAPELARQFGIQGIPAVKAFRGGRVVSEFTGARDMAFLRGWLAGLAPSEAAQALARAAVRVGEGDLPGAEAILRGLLADRETGDRARVELARVLLDQGKPDEVEAVLAGIDPRSESFERVEGLRRWLAMFSEATAAGGEAGARAALAADPKNLDAQYGLGCALAARGDHTGALDAFLEIVGRSRKFRDDAGRRAMLTVFEQLGDEHPLVREYRRKLQIVT